MSDALSAAMRRYSKACAKKIADGIVDALFQSADAKIVYGIWAAIEEEVYETLKRSKVSLWMTGDELEFLFWFGDDSANGAMRFSVEDCLDVKDHEVADLPTQIAGINRMISLLRNYKVRAEVELKLEGEES